MNRKPRYGNERGFSLTELMVVLAILGIMVAASLPFLVPFLRNMTLNSFANDLVTKINSGKMNAAKTNTRVRVFFDYGTNPDQISIDRIDSGNNVIENFYLIEVPDGIEFFSSGGGGNDTFDGNTIVFTPLGENTKLDGTPQSGDAQIRLKTDTDYVRRIEVNNVGNIRVHSTERS
jgi:prepilin-type N-terminal cleavage/methylation domain-containing protein